MNDRRFKPIFGDGVPMCCPLPGSPNCNDKRCWDEDCCIKAQSQMEAAHGVTNPVIVSQEEQLARVTRRRKPHGGGNGNG